MARSVVRLFSSVWRPIFMADNVDLVEFSKKLHELQKIISCTACGQLLTNREVDSSEFCKQHFACKACLGKERDEDRKCENCEDWDTFESDEVIQSLLKSYQNCCSYFLHSENITKQLEIIHESDPTFDALGLIDLVGEGIKGMPINRQLPHDMPIFSSDEEDDDDDDDHRIPNSVNANNTSPTTPSSSQSASSAATTVTKLCVDAETQTDAKEEFVKNTKEQEVQAGPSYKSFSVKGTQSMPVSSVVTKTITTSLTPVPVPNQLPISTVKPVSKQIPSRVTTPVKHPVPVPAVSSLCRDIKSTISVSSSANPKKQGATSKTRKVEPPSTPPRASPEKILIITSDIQNELHSSRRSSGEPSPSEDVPPSQTKTSPSPTSLSSTPPLSTPSTPTSTTGSPLPIKGTSSFMSSGTETVRIVNASTFGEQSTTSTSSGSHGKAYTTIQDIHRWPDPHKILQYASEGLARLPLNPGNFRAGSISMASAQGFSRLQGARSQTAPVGNITVPTPYPSASLGSLGSLVRPAIASSAPTTNQPAAFGNNQPQTLRMVRPTSLAGGAAAIRPQANSVPTSTTTLRQVTLSTLYNNSPTIVVAGPSSSITTSAALSSSLSRRRERCLCGKKNSGRLTCIGQRCPCYAEKKACLGCNCKGCKNPYGRGPGGKKVLRGVRPLLEPQISQGIPLVATAVSPGDLGGTSATVLSGNGNGSTATVLNSNPSSNTATMASGFGTMGTPLGATPPYQMTPVGFGLSGALQHLQISNPHALQQIPIISSNSGQLQTETPAASGIAIQDIPLPSLGAAGFHQISQASTTPIQRNINATKPPEWPQQ